MPNRQVTKITAKGLPRRDVCTRTEKGITNYSVNLIIARAHDTPLLSAKNKSATNLIRSEFRSHFLIAMRGIRVSAPSLAANDTFRRSTTRAANALSRRD